MSKTKVGPEAKIITLFAALPDDSKRIVLDVIKNQSTVPRSATKKTEKPTTSPPAQKEQREKKPAGLCAKTAGEHTCGLPYDNPLHHDNVYADYHPFESAKSVARARRKSRTRSASNEGSESSTPSASTETETAIAAGAGD